MKRDLAVEILRVGFSCQVFPGRIGIKNVGFWGGRKSRGLGEKPLEQGWGPTKNITHMWHQVLKSNPGHSGERWALSLLCHSFSPASLIINIGMLCIQELFYWSGWITWNIVSDIYIFTNGKKSMNVEKNENVELAHTQVFCGRLCMLCE